ncbi:DUF1445 domain-containing protein [Amycolatopsis sp. NPDC023774]|uniref:D-glutamate cyclase family protein n=1 Tax=Amycolatopsis sp. NPDC023774 TaxID=3155015 RepID=UPI0033F095AD
MRLVPAELLDAAVGRITSASSFLPGAPMHVGDPAAPGIADLARPDTPQAVVMLRGRRSPSRTRRGTCS